MEGVVDRQVAKVAGQGVPLAEANLAWAGWLPISWISSLCADPTDSPRPKGWETTLEPYRTLNLKCRRSVEPKFGSNQFRPSLENKESRTGFMHTNSLANIAFVALFSKLRYGIVDDPFHLHRFIQPKHIRFMEGVVRVRPVRVQPVQRLSLIHI